ncbi:XF1762 family protein [Heyndrickxia sporothermodurans]
MTKEAQSFVNNHHRHNVAHHRDKFRIGLNNGEKLIGVVMVGRPIARHNIMV